MTTICGGWSRVAPIVISVAVHIVVYFLKIELSESFELRHYASSLAICIIMLWPVTVKHPGYSVLSYFLRRFPSALDKVNRRRQDRQVQYTSKRVFLAIGVYGAVSIGGVVVATSVYELTPYTLAISIIPVGLLYRLVVSASSNLLTTEPSILSPNTKLHCVVFYVASSLVPILSITATALGKFIIETFGKVGWIPLILGSVSSVVLLDKWLRSNGSDV